MLLGFLVESISLVESVESFLESSFLRWSDGKSVDNLGDSVDFFSQVLGRVDKSGSGGLRVLSLVSLSESENSLGNTLGSLGSLDEADGDGIGVCKTAIFSIM